MDESARPSHLSDDPDPWRSLIASARTGDPAAVDRLLAGCHQYLLLIANQDLDRDLRPKVGASDIVQETLMIAHRNFDQFQGTGRQELFAWVRGILANDLRELRRHYKQTGKRQIQRETAYGTSGACGGDSPDSLYTPGTRASLDEQADRLKSAILELPEQFQVVLRLRNWQQLSFAEIGKHIGKSAEAARKVWARAVAELESRMVDNDPTPR